MKNSDCHIGEQVSWVAGKLQCKGLVLDVKEEDVEIMCFEIGGRRASSKVKIKKDQLNEEL